MMSWLFVITCLAHLFQCLFYVSSIENIVYAVLQSIVRHILKKNFPVPRVRVVGKLRIKGVAEAPCAILERLRTLSTRENPRRISAQPALNWDLYVRFSDISSLMIASKFRNLASRHTHFARVMESRR